MVQIPALRDASDDEKLKGAPLTVYLKFLYLLDPVEYRPVKQAAFALQANLTERTVRSAINTLVERGYVQERDRKGESKEYRLVFSRMPIVPLDKDADRN